MVRKIKFYFVTLLILGLAGLAVYYRYVPRPAVTRSTVDTPAVLRQIQQLSELATVKYNIQKVIGLEEQKIPFGSEKVMLLVQATVKAGVNLKDVAADGSVIRLPPPILTDVYIDERETKVWDRSKTWWTPWVSLNPELEQNARRAALEAVQQTALQMGILSNAQRNAETVVREFLHTAGMTNVTFWTIRTPRAD
jgi:hypothetical protein